MTDIDPSSSVLRSRAVSFCAAFLDPSSNPPSTLLTTHFTPSGPKITEHGPAWATSRLPFLGKTFKGRRSPPPPSSSSSEDKTESTTLSSSPSLPPPASVIASSDGQSGKGTTCDDYFDLLSQTLSFHPDEDTFPPADEFIVDAHAGPRASGVGAASTGAASQDTQVTREESGSSGREGKRGGGGAVSVVAHAKFASVKTGRSWEERFIYRLSEFDEKGRIGHWEIWADPLSAWTAVGGDAGEDG
ncbi:MAG: hypothetical protein M1837_003894 [Sclerophora amabilis]|nr:MAG: hypothetical protein M1837_003894 [Sclerophora amabilis]